MLLIRNEKENRCSVIGVDSKFRARLAVGITKGRPGASAIAIASGVIDGVDGDGPGPLCSCDTKLGLSKEGSGPLCNCDTKL